MQRNYGIESKNYCSIHSNTETPRPTYVDMCVILTGSQPLSLSACSLVSALIDGTTHLSVFQSRIILFSLIRVRSFMKLIVVHRLQTVKGHSEINNNIFLDDWITLSVALKVISYLDFFYGTNNSRGQRRSVP